MSKEMKRYIASILLIVMFCALMVGCGSADKAKETQTTKNQETNSIEAPTTTEKPIEEETSTEYVYKGEHFAVKASLKDYFMDLTIQKGDKIYLNELIGKDDGDEYDRGNLGDKITSVLYFKNHYDKYEVFVDTYRIDGTAEYSIPYDKNVVIEYNEDEKLYFHFVKDRGKYVDFDVY